MSHRNIAYIASLEGLEAKEIAEQIILYLNYDFGSYKKADLSWVILNLDRYLDIDRWHLLNIIAYLVEIYCKGVDVAKLKVYKPLIAVVFEKDILNTNKSYVKGEL